MDAIDPDKINIHHEAVGMSNNLWKRLSNQINGKAMNPPRDCVATVALLACSPAAALVIRTALRLKPSGVALEPGP